MKYAVKEIFYSLQGEGVNTGRPAIFCRFAGCNLWSGREEDRGKAVCRFCDTDFLGTDGAGGGDFLSPGALARAVRGQWPGGSGAKPFVICTGGEPLLQLDGPLVDAFRELGIEVAVETNGTLSAPVGIGWMTVSPKAGAELVLDCGDELKLVYPQAGADPKSFVKLRFRHFLLQPMDGPLRVENTRAAIDYCLAHPQWRLSPQTHKILGIR